MKNVKTNICFHCGAHYGLHHSGTDCCPDNPYIENGKWANTTFVDTGEKRLLKAAPDLLDAAIAARAIFTSMGIDENNRIVGGHIKTLNAAIKKAGW